MVVTNALQVAEGVAAGQLFQLVGAQGQAVLVTEEGFLKAIDTVAREEIQNDTYGLESIYSILASGGVSVDLDAIIEDLGNPSSRSNLNSIEDIIGWQDDNADQTIGAVIGVNVGDRYRSAGSIASDFDTLLDSRLTSARAGYLDNINNSNLQSVGANITLNNINSEVDTALDTAIGSPTADSIAERIQTLDDNYTATRAGYLDELSSGNIPSDLDTVLSRLSAARASGLDYIEASAISNPTSGSIAERIKTLDDNYTATRAGYLDNIGSGDLGTVQNEVQNGTYGLSSLKTLIDENQTDLDTVISDVSTVDSVVDTNQSELQDGTYGLSALDTKMAGGKTSGTKTYSSGTAEQDIIEFTKTNIYSVLSLWLDLSNFTNGSVVTIRTYAKIDGTNYVQQDVSDFTIGTHDSVSITPVLNIDHNWKITAQIDTTEGSDTSIPFRYVVSDLT